MAYQADGTNFEAEFTSDVAVLRIKAVRGPKGDRYQATIERV